MSEKTQIALLSGFLEVPEYDDSEDMDDVEDEAIFKSSMLEIIEVIGEDDFKVTFLEFINDINLQPFKNKTEFCIEVLEKINEVYEFTFPVVVEFLSEQQYKEFKEFLAFIEYDNYRFLSFVWQFINVDIMKINIQQFADENADKIIKEVEEQSQVHVQNNMITIFIRTHFREGFIKWFTKSSEKNKVEIAALIMERKENKNE
jgi:hypothetical protein